MFPKKQCEEQQMNNDFYSKSNKMYNTKMTKERLDFLKRKIWNFVTFENPLLFLGGGIKF